MLNRCLQIFTLCLPLGYGKTKDDTTGVCSFTNSLSTLIAR